MDKDIFFAPERLNKTEKEIEYLRTVCRKEVAERIRVALGRGDLSENSEYDEAKNEQTHVEERIAGLENIARDTRVVEEDEIDKDTVSVEAHVKIKSKKSGEEDVSNIISSTETDPLEGKILNESPVGAALIGCKVGDVIEIGIPDGMIHYEVVEISL